MKEFNVVEREKLRFIHDTYFNPDSDHVLDFNLLDSLHSADLITDEELESMEKILGRIGSDLHRTIAREDKRLLKENFK